MLEQLFGSKTRFKILRHLFRGPGKPFFVRELARDVETQVNAVRREIGILVQLGLLKEETEKPKANTAEYGSTLRKYYRLNVDSVLYDDLKNLIGKMEIIGEEALIKDIKEQGGKIKLFLLTGRFTKNSGAPSDILLVGDLKERNVAKIIADYEKELGFEVRYTIMSEMELKERRQMMDKFIFAMFEAENVKVINELKV